MTKNYYKILGVLDDAESIVIRSAYKALAQKYHPDKWEGDLKEATHRMSEINEAYEVLSNEDKRKSFDETRGKSEYQENSSNQNDLLYSVEADWKKVLEYFPQLMSTTQNLSKISKELEFTFKVILLENKSFDKSTEIAQQLEQHYLEKYFGADKEILRFAKKLILDNQKKAARELNQAVKLLGSDIDSALIINRIVSKFNLEANVKLENSDELKIAAINLKKDSDILSALTFLRLLNYSVYDVGWFKQVFLIETGKNKYKMSSDELVLYAKHMASIHGFI